MDLNALLNTMLSSDSVKQIGAAAGVSPDEVQKVLGAAMPGLLNGALAQSQSGDTAEGFANALVQHGADDTSDVSRFMGKVDLADGGKIVSHLLGGDGAALNAIAAQSGVSKKSTGSILSAAAPLLMSLLGQQTGQSSQGGGSGLNTAGLMGLLLQNVDLGSVLTGLLGGSAQSQTQPIQEEKPQASGLLGMLGNFLK